MEAIFRALVNAISKIVVLCGGEEITINETIFGDILNWFEEIGVKFAD